ncbi:hypothetical protein, partial [Escherichia coli]|uniref:hypothetical protein n=1 Tax=Escherichia coli TaxID=562 RepID=UPI0013D83FE1
MSKPRKTGMAALRARLCCGLLLLALAAGLSAEPSPGSSAGNAAEDAAPVELATSPWTQAQLDAWWAALRRQTVAGGDHLALS